jgi:hypothetical protein
LFVNAELPPSPTQHPDRAAERFAILRELADIEMEIARALQGAVRERAEAVEDAGVYGDLGSGPT